MPFFFSRSDSRSDFSTDVVPTSTGCPVLRQAHDFVRRREVLLFLRAIHHVRILNAPQFAVGRNHHDFQLVNLVELGGFRFRRTGHAGQLLVHAEVILEGHGGERLIFALDLHAFLGFHRLVQSIGPAASRHQAAGELIDDEHLAVLHHVFHIATIERMRLDRGIDVVFQVPVLRIGDVADAQQPLDLLPSHDR